MTIELTLCLAALACSNAILAMASWVAIRKRRVYSFLLLALAMYGLITLVALPGLAIVFSDEDAEVAAMVFTVGTLLLLGSISVFERIVGGQAGFANPNWIVRLTNSGSAHVKCTLVTTPLSLLLMVSSLTSLEVTWSQARAEGIGVMGVAATFLLLISVPGAVSAWCLGMRLRAAGLFCGALLVFAFNGSRAAVLSGVAYMAWLLLNRAATRGKRFRVLLGVGAAAFFAHVGLRVIRGLGVVGLVAAYHSGNVSNLFISGYEGGDVSGGEGAMATNLVVAVHDADETFGFATSVQRTILLFVPKEVLPAKPPDVTYLLWEKGFRRGLFEGAEGYAALEDSFESGRFGSLHPTLFGELFVSGRWAALIISCVFCGALCIFIDRALAKMNDLAALLLVGPTLVGMIFVARGNSVIGFGNFFYLSVGILAIQWLFRRFHRGRGAYQSTGAPLSLTHRSRGH